MVTRILEARKRASSRPRQDILKIGLCSHKPMGLVFRKSPNYGFASYINAA
jgi:hypothetical protein